MKNEVQEYRRMRNALLISAELTLKDDKEFQETMKKREEILHEINDLNGKMRDLKSRAGALAIEQEKLLLKVIPEEYHERK